jgi:hypothetical protein
MLRPPAMAPGVSLIAAKVMAAISHNTALPAINLSTG